MHSRKVLIDYVFAVIRWITMYISFRGFMPRKSIYSGCTPCTLAAKVLPKGIVFCQRLRFSGVKGYRVPLSIEPWNKSRATVFSWAIRIHKFKKVLSYQICS